MHKPLEKSLVRIINRNGLTVGTGFLVANDVIATCAHVVENAGGKLGEEIKVIFYGRTQPIRATVLQEYWRDSSKEDVAFLHISELPTSFYPVYIGSSQGTKTHAIHTRGFPNINEEGGIAGDGVIVDDNVPINQIRHVQLRSTQITPGFSGAPVLNTVTRRIVGMVVSITREQDGRLNDTAFMIPSETLQAIYPALQCSDISPYRSLEIFTEQDAEFFFGRDQFVSQLLNNLRREPRFLAVLGPSGSGKSSVIQAGLLPKLRQGEVPGSDNWTILKPTRPATLLAEGLEAFQQTLQVQTPHKVLVLDQFEEFFTTNDLTASQVFLDYLIQVLEGNFDLSLIIALRSDFQALLADKASQLATWVDHRLLRIPPTLSIEELKQIIRKPAEVVGVNLEAGLVEDLVEDVLNEATTASIQEKVGRSTVLPLLEFTLKELWERRKDGFLTQEAFHKLEGVSGSLTQWATKTYYSLLPEEQFVAQRMLTDLVHLGDETLNIPDSRRRRTLSELVLQPDERETVQHIIQHLSQPEHRLIFTSREGGQEYVELIHDALIREWKLYQDWLRENREFLVWRQAVEPRARGWLMGDEGGQRDEGKLLRGGDLVVALDWVNKKIALLGTDLLEYIQSSQAYETLVREREIEQAHKLANTQRQRSIVLTVGLIIAVILSIIAFSLFQQSSRNLGVANTANTQTAAEIIVRSTAQNEAEVRRIEAENSQATAETEAIFRATAQADAEFQRQEAEEKALVAQIGELSAVAINQFDQHIDLAWLLSIEAFKTRNNLQTQNALFQTWKSQPNLRQILHGHSISVYGVAWSSDGRLASSSSDGSIIIWNLITGLPDQILQAPTSAINSIAWAKDGRLASGLGDGSIIIWNLDTEQPAQTLQSHTRSVTSLAWSDNGYLASGSSDSTVIIWDLINSQPNKILRGHKGFVTSVAWSGDNYLASGSWDTNVIVWDVFLGEPAFILHEETGIVFSVAWSNDGRLASGGDDGRIIIWDLSIKQPDQILYGHQNLVFSLAWSNDGRLASGSGDKTIIIWDLLTSQPTQTLKAHTAEVNSVAWSNNLLASGSYDANVIVWDSRTQQPIKIVGTSTITSFAWSGDGRIATGFSDGKITIWDVETRLAILNLQVHTSQVDNLDWTGDGSLLSGAWDGNAIVWDLKTGNPIHILQAQTGFFNKVAWLKNDRIITSLDGEIIVWNAVTEQIERSFAGEDFVVSNDGILFYYTGKEITIIDLNTYQSIYNIQLEQFTYWTNHFSYNFETGLLAVAQEEGEITIWDIMTGSLVKTLKGHSRTIFSLAWGADGRLASSSFDDSVIIWDMESGQPAQIFKEQFVENVSWAEEKLLFSHGRVLSIWDFNPNFWVNQSCQRASRNLTEAEWNQYLSWKGDYDPNYRTCPQWPSAEEMFVITPTPIPKN